MADEAAQEVDATAAAATRRHVDQGGARVDLVTRVQGAPFHRQPERVPRMLEAELGDEDLGDHGRRRRGRLEVGHEAPGVPRAGPRDGLQLCHLARVALVRVHGVGWVLGSYGRGWKGVLGVGLVWMGVLGWDWVGGEGVLGLVQGGGMWD